ncbi:MAG: hypothetical protein Devi2KO_40430 [Devosia indica]
MRTKKKKKKGESPPQEKKVVKKKKSRKNIYVSPPGKRDKILEIRKKGF